MSSAACRCCFVFGRTTPTTRHVLLVPSVLVWPPERRRRPYFRHDVRGATFPCFEVGIRSEPAVEGLTPLTSGFLAQDFRITEEAVPRSVLRLYHNEQRDQSTNDANCGLCSNRWCFSSSCRCGASQYMRAVYTSQEPGRAKA